MVSCCLVASGRREAIAAVNRLVATRLERNFRNSAAAAASGFEHLTTSAAAATTVAAFTALRFTRSAAVDTTAGLVGEALGSEEFLFARRERELISAVDAF